jgi:hypothetical protein
MNATPNNDLFKPDAITVLFIPSYLSFLFMYYLFDKSFLFVDKTIGITVVHVKAILTIECVMSVSVNITGRTVECFL